MKADEATFEALLDARRKILDASHILVFTDKDLYFANLLHEVAEKLTDVINGRDWNGKQ